MTEADSPDGAGFSDEAFTYDKVGNRLTSLDAPGPWAYKGNNALTARDEPEATVFPHQSPGTKRFAWDER